MADTPQHYIDVLDLITARKPPSPKNLGALEAREYRRLRDAFADRNMVGIGVGEKVVEKRGTGRLSVCFYIEKAIPDSRLRNSKLIPPVIKAPNGQAVFTDIKVIGKIRPEVNKKATPAQSGFSVSHQDANAGTLGAIVRKGNNLFVLSNSHVLAKSGTGEIGDAILYPGKSDGGVLGSNQIATLSKVVKFTPGGDFVNICDAALAQIDPARINDLDRSIFGVTGRPGIVAPVIGMKVIKRGRSSGDTEGEILDVNFRAVFPYPQIGADVGFVDQVLCTRYTRDGDSGSIVVAKDSGKIVGLHFAGSAVSSVFSPIQTVIDALGFQFV